MGRELRRKQAKREGKSLQKPVVKEENNTKKMFKIVFGLIAFFAILYLLLGIFVTKEIKWFDKSNNNNNSSNGSGVTNSILASAIFKQSPEEYYVYFYDFSDEDKKITSAITTNITNLQVYRVDTSSAMNSKYVSDETNKDAKNLEQLKVKAPTLIKITGETITEYYESNEIINNLK